MCFVYWIRRENHVDIKSQGYVGVSNNPKQRFKEHYKKNNSHLFNALEKYKDIKIYVIIEESMEFCLLLEQEYRPEENIGWNMCKGGGYPPSAIGRSPTVENISRLIESNRNRVWTNKEKERVSKQEKLKFADGSHYFLKEEIRKATSERNKIRNSIEYKCPYCELIGKGPGMLFYHFEKCKYKDNPKEIKERNWYFKQKHECPHCGLIGSGQTMKRWHFDRCKKKEDEINA